MEKGKKLFSRLLPSGRGLTTLSLRFSVHRFCNFSVGLGALGKKTVPASLFLPAQFLYSAASKMSCAAVLGSDMRAPLPRAPVVRASLGPSAAAALPWKNNGSYPRPWYVLMLLYRGIGVSGDQRRMEPESCLASPHAEASFSTSSPMQAHRVLHLLDGQCSQKEHHNISPLYCASQMRQHICVSRRYDAIIPFPVLSSVSRDTDCNFLPGFSIRDMVMRS